MLHFYHFFFSSYNSGNDGSPGTLATTTNGYYYTFNIEDVSAASNPNMIIPESNFNPVTISSVSATFNGSPGTAIIPCQTGGASVSYYVYSSTRSKSTIDADATTYGQTDMIYLH